MEASEVPGTVVDSGNLVRNEKEDTPPRTSVCQLHLEFRAVQARRASGSPGHPSTDRTSKSEGEK